MTIRRRTVFSTAALAATLAACTNGSPEGAAGGDPLRGGSLSWGVGTEPTAGGVGPMVATDWATPDDLTFVFTLRTDAAFADGAPFTADDVVHTFETYQQAQTSRRAYLVNLTAVEATGEHEVTLRLSAPDGTLMNALSSRETFMVVGRAGYGGADADTRQRTTFGTGPFQVTDWTDGVSITLSRNPIHPDEKPLLDEVVLELLPDESTRLAALQQGSVQAASFTDSVLADQAGQSGSTLGDPSYTPGDPGGREPRVGAVVRRQGPAGVLPGPGPAGARRHRDVRVRRGVDHPAVGRSLGPGRGRGHPELHAGRRGGEGTARRRRAAEPRDHHLLLRGRVGEPAPDLRTHAAAGGRGRDHVGWQNIEPIENDLDRLDLFAALGVRIVQLAYNVRNLVANGCFEQHDDGLSHFGVRAVGRLNELGVLIDLSHVGDRSSREAIEFSTRPVAFTHTNLREFHDSPRNKPAELLRPWPLGVVSWGPTRSRSSCPAAGTRRCRSTSTASNG